VASAIACSGSLIAGRNSRLQAISYTHFLEQMRQINLYCADGQSQLVGDLLIGVALCDMLEELLLSIGERSLHLGDTFRDQRSSNQQTGGQLGCDVGLSFMDGL